MNQQTKMDKNQAQPRLSVVISDEDYHRLREITPWGTKKSIFTELIHQMSDLCKKHGAGLIMGGILKGTVKLQLVEEKSDGPTIGS